VARYLNHIQSVVSEAKRGHYLTQNAKESYNLITVKKKLESEAHQYITLNTQSDIESQRCYLHIEFCRKVKNNRTINQKQRSLTNKQLVIKLSRLFHYCLCLVAKKIQPGG
jgi:hypothetical protein